MSTQLQAQAALIEYGYIDDGFDNFTRFKGDVPRDQYVAVAGDGFLRFTRVDGVWKGVPYTIAPGFEGVSGADSAKPEHVAMFDWTYPAGEILRIYSAGAEARDQHLAEHAAQRAAASGG